METRDDICSHRPKTSKRSDVCFTQQHPSASSNSCYIKARWVHFEVFRSEIYILYICTVLFEKNNDTVNVCMVTIATIVHFKKSQGLSMDGRRRK